MGAYRIGWWRPWWPTRDLLIGLVTGNQPSPRADNGSRFVGRRRFIRPIVSRAKCFRLPRQPWQAESDMFHINAVRAFTRRGAEQKLHRAEQQVISTAGRFGSMHHRFEDRSP